MTKRVDLGRDVAMPRLSRAAAAPAMVLALGAVLTVVAPCLVADRRQRFACCRPRIAWARSS